MSRHNKNDPLLQLQRPSSASLHSTAHILSSCFADFVDEPVYKRSKGNHGRAVETSIVSSSEESNHSKKLREVGETYRKKIQELSLVEEHLTAAKTKASVDDEKKLAEYRREFPTAKESLVPNEPSTFREYLDEELLTRHCLLTPSSYYPDDYSFIEPPKAPSTPTYQQGTRAFAQHTKGRTLPDVRERSTGIRKRRDEQSTTKMTPLWKDVLSTEERMEGKAALTELSRRSEYLRNPRHRSTCLSNTAASAGLKPASRGAPLTTSSPEFFVSEPTEVVFSEYLAGKSHEATVTLKNVSSASHQLRILPPKTTSFSVSLGQFPTSEGVMAPGMSCSYGITFTPLSLEDYTDELTVLLHTGASFTVPLLGRRPHPDVNLPLAIDVGSCLAGSSREISLPSLNSGGEGGFAFHSLHSSPSFVESNRKLLVNEERCEVGAFSISPRAFYLPTGSSVDVKVVFSPSVVGSYKETLTLSCDNCSTFQVTLAGMADKLSIGVSEIEECSEVNRHRTLSCIDFRPSTGGSTTRDYSEDPSSATLSTEAGHREAEFGTTNPEQAVNRKIRVRNNSESQLPFQWVLYRPEIDRCLSGEGEGGGSQQVVNASQLHLSTDSPFNVHPLCGCFEPVETKTFILSFHPSKIGSFLDMAHLTLFGVPRTSMDEERFLELKNSQEEEELEEDCDPLVKELAHHEKKQVGDETNGLPKTEEEHNSKNRDENKEGRLLGSSSPSCTALALSIEMAGQCEAYDIELCPPRLDSLSFLDVGALTKRSLKIVNRSLCNVQFEWSWEVLAEGEPHQGSTRFNSGSGGNGGSDNLGVTVEPGEGSVVAGRECECTVHFVPRRSGQYTAVLKAAIKNLPSTQLRCPVLANARGPVLSLEVPSLDFGLVRVGKKETLALPLRNESSTPLQFSVSRRPLETGSPALTDCVALKVSSGELPARGRTTLLVSFEPSHPGHLRALLRCAVPGSQPQYVSVTGEAQSPVMSLECSHRHADDAYVHVPLQGTVVLRNHTLIPTQFMWSQKLVGEGAAVCALTLSPAEGQIGPREEVTIHYTATWSQKGSVPPVIATCFVEETEYPLHLSLSASVRGVSVRYELLSSAQDQVLDAYTDTADDLPRPPTLDCDDKGGAGGGGDGGDPSESDLRNVSAGSKDVEPNNGGEIRNKTPCNDSAEASSTSSEDRLSPKKKKNTDFEDLNSLHLDFGPSSPLGSERSLELRVTNLSGIATTIDASVAHFPASLLQCSKTETGSTSKLSISRRSILIKTANLASPHSKTDQQLEKKAQDALLSGGRGACFVVTPVKMELGPFASGVLTILAYSDMWGEYRDRLQVKVEGLAERTFPISYCAVGCPIRFMNTNSFASSSLRFGSRALNSTPVSRTFKVQNTSYRDIRVNWQIYCILPKAKDPKLVDFVLRVGDLFPLISVTSRGSPRDHHPSELSTITLPTVSALLPNPSESSTVTLPTVSALCYNPSESSTITIPTISALVPLQSGSNILHLQSGSSILPLSYGSSPLIPGSKPSRASLAGVGSKPSIARMSTTASVHRQWMEARSANLKPSPRSKSATQRQQPQQQREEPPTERVSAQNQPDEPCSVEQGVLGVSSDLTAPVIIVETPSSSSEQSKVLHRNAACDDSDGNCSNSDGDDDESPNSAEPPQSKHLTLQNTAAAATAMGESTPSKGKIDVHQRSSLPLIKSTITPHEGIMSNFPYAVDPPYQVLPGKWSSSLTVTFSASLEALNTCGPNQHAYALGFMTPKGEESCPHVTRASADDVVPLRIDLLASIEHALLSLTTEDSEDDRRGVELAAKASQLYAPRCEELDSIGKIEGVFFLNNPNSSQLSFSLLCCPPFHLSTLEPGTGLTSGKLDSHLLPKKTLHVKLCLSLSLRELRDLTAKRKESFDKTASASATSGGGVNSSVRVDGELYSAFSTGAKQSWPLSASISLPSMAVGGPGEDGIVFQQCFVGTPATRGVVLRNRGYSAAYWQARLASGHPSFSIDSSFGVLDPHMTNGRDSVHSLTVTYRPSTEEEADDVLLLSETITGWTVSIALSGSSFADEKLDALDM